MAEGVTSARQGFLDFSPVRRNDGNKENDVPVLSLIQFSKPPFVTFGTVKLGTSKSAVLRVENPTDDMKVEVTVDKIPSSKGFSVDHNTFTIQVCFNCLSTCFVQNADISCFGCRFDVVSHFLLP